MKAFINFTRSALAAIVVLLALNADLRGQLIQEPDLPAEEGKLVRFWLNDGWDKGSQQNDKSVKVFKAAAPRDSNVLLAYAINRLQHNRSTEAVAVVEAAVARDGDNLDAILFSIWLKMVRDDYDVALIEMQSFADSVKRSGVKPEKLKFAYRRLGRLLGFLQGPAAGQCNPDILERTIERLNDGLDVELKKSLVDRAAAVTAKYDQLLKELDQKVQDSIQNNAAANKVSQKVLAQQGDALKAQTGQIQQRRSDLEMELERKVSVLVQGLAPLEAELRNQIAQIDNVRSQITYNQTSQLYSQVNSQGLLLTNQLNRFQVRQSHIALQTLRSNANQIYNTIAVEQNKINRLQTGYNGELRKLDKGIRKSTNLQVRNANKLVKAAAGPQPNAGAVAALNNRTSALTIYDPLALEQYRADFLRSLPREK